jgi:hypothetical protein
MRDSIGVLSTTKIVGHLVKGSVLEVGFPVETKLNPRLITSG